jgi:hypothetical protein
MTLLKQHYIIEGEYLGSGLRQPFSTVGTSLTVYSYAFFCKKCGRIWASCPIDKPGIEWHVVNTPCPRDTREAWGGSIFLTYDKEFIEPMPPAVLTREFNWLLSKMEKHL